ncbi:MAG: hypothetical protein N2491_01340 [Negativicutes bacterium]|nr:hypothetical protein [Negativicutes bacterium]
MLSIMQTDWRVREEKVMVYLSRVWYWLVGRAEDLDLPDEKCRTAVNQLVKRAFCLGFCAGMAALYLLLG